MNLTKELTKEERKCEKRMRGKRELQRNDFPAFSISEWQEEEREAQRIRRAIKSKTARVLTVEEGTNKDLPKADNGKKKEGFTTQFSRLNTG